jgi:hypothetical protein
MCSRLLVPLLLFAMASFSPGESKQQPTRPPAIEHQSNGTSDISGMYTFLREGEYVQVTIEAGNVVSGFVSRWGDSEGDKGALLGHFFEKAGYDGQNLTFATEIVHGTSFQFSGKVLRGAALSPSRKGYWILKGTLTEIKQDAVGKTDSKSREVEFKSFPQDLDQDEIEIPPRK